jgi:hypothetical protein
MLKSNGFNWLQDTKRGAGSKNLRSGGVNRDRTGLFSPDFPFDLDRGWRSAAILLEKQQDRRGRMGRAMADATGEAKEPPPAGRLRQKPHPADAGESCRRAATMYELLQVLTLVFMVGLGILLSNYPFENYGVALVAASYLMPSLLLSAAFGWRLGMYLSTGRLRGPIGLLLGYIVGLIIVFPIIVRLLKSLIVNVIFT